MARSPKNVRINPNVPAKHPINDDKSAKKLIEHVKARLDFANTRRESIHNRMERIDKAFFAYKELDRDDKKRESDNLKGKSTKPVHTKVPFGAAKIDDMVTYCLSIFAPDTGMFEAIADQDTQDVAKAFTNDLNKSASMFGTYHELNKFLAAAFRYNHAGVHIEWDTIYGGSVAEDLNSALVQDGGVIWSGNRIRALDGYNTFWDISVPYVDVPLYGEFIAEAALWSNFKLQKTEQQGEIWGARELINNSGRSYETSYYQEHPRVRGIHEAEDPENWDTTLSGGAHGKVHSGTEVVTYTGWLIPEEFNLVSGPTARQPAERKMEIWEIKLGNMQKVLSARPINNAHGMLPYAFTAPNTDILGGQAHSYFEMLHDLQEFANFLLNLHVVASRRKLYGIIIYDPDVVDLQNIQDRTTGYIPTNPSKVTEDVRKHFLPLNDAPDTMQTMQDLGNVLELMDRILPTDILRQVADLQRATQYQAAATVQGGNRKNYKIVRIIDSQAFNLIRMQLMFNTYQYRSLVTMINDKGDRVEIRPSDYRKTQLEFLVSDGLKGIDKLVMVEMLKEVINAVIQSQQAIQEIDIMKLLDYWTSLIGDKTDLSQFRKEMPTLIDFLQTVSQSLEPEIAQQVMMLGQQMMASAKEQPTDDINTADQDTA